jgi:alanyl-tRNA synthetase
MSGFGTRTEYLRLDLNTKDGKTVIYTVTFPAFASVTIQQLKDIVKNWATAEKVEITNISIPALAVTNIDKENDSTPVYWPGFGNFQLGGQVLASGKTNDAVLQLLEQRMALAEQKFEELKKAVGGGKAEKPLEWPVARVRDTFNKFFMERAHTHVVSSPVVPHDDPTLLFANSGMNQFKPIFLGQIDPRMPMASLKRACNSQKCIRAGGKHNDLEDVGKDTYHHTFFEMLGNWSFGDYFKKEAIDWAWDLLVNVYGLPQDRLYATYFGGNPEFKLEPDNEARELWLRYLPKERVLPFGMKENFWEMGDTGPCGPCSEIHFDRIGGRDVAHLVNRDDPTVIEIWNLVFMQFSREADRSLKPLPNKHVDTGMGLERLTSILQNVHSNYDSDVFMPIFKEIENITKAPGYSFKVGKDDTDNKDMAYRVIADHIRTLTFAITDGAAPGNEGRGYVLKRILRRAVRYGRQVLKAPSGFFSKLVPVVVKLMGDAFPEIKKKQQDVVRILQEEEAAFERTLDKGIEHFNKAIDRAQKEGKTVLSGVDAFTLYDTYGFPVDLTQLMAEEKKFTVDMKEYHEKMEEKRDASGAQQKAADNFIELDAEATSALQKKNIPTTDDSFKYTHPGETINGKVLAIWSRSKKGFVEKSQVDPTELVGVIVDKTNFYSEAGGQTFDTGVLKTSNGAVEVVNVQAYAGFVVHIGKLVQGTLSVGDSSAAQVNNERRSPIAVNHTFTHVLNFALRQVLKSATDQKGSLVDNEKLRFDFSYNKPLTPAEIAQVEAICNDIIQKNLEVYSAVVPLEKAKAINGLRAVFGEVYPDPVNVVSVGVPVEELLAKPENPAWNNYSIEFCGGTHIKKTGVAQHFVIVSEIGTAKGIRRITAWTGDLARKLNDTAAAFQKDITSASQLKDGEALSSEITRLNAILNTAALPERSKADFKSQIDSLVEAKVALSKNALSESLKQTEELLQKLGNSKLLVAEVNAQNDKKNLSACVQAIRDKNPEIAAILFTRDSKKLTVVSHVGKSLQDKISAGDWAKEVAAAANGKGGGSKDAGQASGDADKLDAAVKKATEYAKSRV